MATYNNDENWPDELLVDEDFMHWVDVFFDERNMGDDWHATHDFLEEWLWDHYELVLDDFIDWKDYGDWYDSVH